MQPRERLIFPLDVPNKKEAGRFISLLKDHVGLFKVGLELLWPRDRLFCNTGT